MCEVYYTLSFGHDSFIKLCSTFRCAVIFVTTQLVTTQLNVFVTAQLDERNSRSFRCIRGTPEHSHERAGGTEPRILSHRMYVLISYRKSTPPKIVNFLFLFIVYCY
jgi:hypothetical protein